MSDADSKITFEGIADHLYTKTLSDDPDVKMKETDRWSQNALKEPKADFDEVELRAMDNAWRIVPK